MAQVPIRFRMPGHLRPAFLRAAAACLLLGAAAPLGAQDAAPDLRTEVPAGGETERYLRALQTAGAAPLYPWTLRGFSPAELEVIVPADADHPWAARLPAAPADSARDSTRSIRARLLRPRMDAVFNSAYPQGENDGPVWAGRGMTVSAAAGVQLRVGALSARLEPLVFWAENRDFDLVPLADSIRFQDGRTPGIVDLPQRFGEGSFARVDPGESWVRVDARGVALGASTATQVWGPALDQPLVLGANAAGFPHVFLGTSRPWNVWIGRLHARILWGSLGQSEYSPMRGHGSRRFMSGVLGTFQPRGLDGLEVGVARFFHDPWPRGGLSGEQLVRPVESFFKVSLDRRDEPGGPVGVENQLSSVFARWVLPRAGLEIFGEYMRDDHSWDALDALLEPERSRGYLVGGRKAWLRGERMTALRAEWLTTQQTHVVQAAYTGLVYRHSILRQGHTSGGQLLASPAAFGGGGSVVALERWSPRGRWSVDWTRARVFGPYPRGINIPREVDVVHSLGGEAVLFGGRADLVARLRGSLELNRQFRDDAFNVHAGLGLRLAL